MGFPFTGPDRIQDSPPPNPILPAIGPFFTALRAAAAGSTDPSDDLCPVARESDEEAAFWDQLGRGELSFPTAAWLELLVHSGGPQAEGNDLPALPLPSAEEADRLSLEKLTFHSRSASDSGLDRWAVGLALAGFVRAQRAGGHEEEGGFLLLAAEALARQGCWGITGALATSVQAHSASAPALASRSAWLLAESFRNQEAPEVALALLGLCDARQIETDPAFAARFWNSRAACLFDLLDYPQALHALAQAQVAAAGLQGFPDEPLLVITGGALELALGQRDDASASAEAALTMTLDPGRRHARPAALLFAAEAATRSGEDEEALRLLREAESQARRRNHQPLAFRCRLQRFALSHERQRPQEWLRHNLIAEKPRLCLDRTTARLYYHCLGDPSDLEAEGQGQALG